MQKYRLYLTRLQKDDLKTSSSGLKHPDNSPIDAPENPPESIKLQHNEAISSQQTLNNHLIIQSSISSVHEVDIKGNAPLQIIKPKKIITGYAAKTGISNHFQSTEYSPFNSVLPTQYSWGGGSKEIQFKQKHNPPQFQVQNACLTGLGLPTQQNTLPSFQPPDQVSGPTCTERTSIHNMEFSPFLLQGQHFSPTNNHQNKGVAECNDQELLLYDELRFDYEYPPDSLEYPVIDQGLFIV